MSQAKVQAVLHSQWQQAISENQEFERILNQILQARQTLREKSKPGEDGQLKVPRSVAAEFVNAVELALLDFQERMRPIRKMRKARPR